MNMNTHSADCYATWSIIQTQWGHLEGSVRRDQFSGVARRKGWLHHLLAASISQRKEEKKRKEVVPSCTCHTPSVQTLHCALLKVLYEGTTQISPFAHKLAQQHLRSSARKTPFHLLTADCELLSNAGHSVASIVKSHLCCSGVWGDEGHRRRYHTGGEKKQLNFKEVCVFEGPYSREGKWNNKKKACGSLASLFSFLVRLLRQRLLFLLPCCLTCDPSPCLWTRSPCWAPGHWFWMVESTPWPIAWFKNLPC